jgi:4a-hydroxytetrahydrobiopterin dehydratase
VPERITPQQFHDADGVEDWREVGAGVCAYFRTGSFATGVALVVRIGALADAANHHPDVDLRYPGLTVRLITHEVGGLSDRDVDLARQISAAARELDATADPSEVQTVQLTIDAATTADVRPFWRAVLGYKEVGDEDVVDPHGRNPSIWFQGLDAPRPQRNRMHIDVFVPPELAAARIAAAVDAGGRVVDDSHAPSWVVLADPEGNEVCVATWMGRD